MEGDEVQAGPALAADGVGGPFAFAGAVGQEGVHEARRPLAPGDGGPAHLDLPQGPGEPGHGVVVEVAVLLHGAPPVGDVRLVPQLPVPAAHLFPAVALDAVPGQLEHQLLPAPDVPRGEAPLVGLVGGVEGGAAGEGQLRVRGHQGAGRKSQLHQGLEAHLAVGVEDEVDRRPVVRGVPGAVLVVDVAGAPVGPGEAPPAGEQVVGAHEVGALGEGAEGPQGPLPARGVGPVQLVVAERRPGPGELAHGLGAIDPDPRHR